MITIADGSRTFEINDKDIEIAETDCLDFYEWIINSALEKCRRVLDGLVLEHTNLNPVKLSKDDKLANISSIPLKSVRQKNAEFEAKMKGIST